MREKKSICLWCRDPVQEGEPIKKCNIGGEIGVRHEINCKAFTLINQRDETVDLGHPILRFVPLESQTCYPCDK